MPDLTGIEVLDQLKNNGEARAVIMITADPQPDDVKAALKLGAYDFISKPVDFDELGGRTSREEVEHSMVELAMRQANENQTHAAKLLDTSRDALRCKLKRFGLIRGDDEASQISTLKGSRSNNC
jgi:DNA-binding NtrC family response regulator